MGIQLAGMGIAALDWEAWLGWHLPTLVAYALIAWTLLAYGLPVFIEPWGEAARRSRDERPTDDEARTEPPLAPSAWPCDRRTAVLDEFLYLLGDFFGLCLSAFGENRYRRDHAVPMDELRAASDRRWAQILAERAAAQPSAENPTSTGAVGAADAPDLPAPPARPVNARPSTRGPSTRGPSTRGPSTRPPRGG